MLVLGVSSLEHDTAAALVSEDGPVAAIEEDKVNRSSVSIGVPRLAIESCLREAGARAADLSLWALASRPKRAWLRRQGLRLTSPSAVPCHAGTADALFWKVNQVRLLAHAVGPRVPLVNFEHHLCHAASAFFPSAFDRALILTLDEFGDMWSGLLALGEGSELRVLCPIRFPNSLGWFYTRVTELLGFRPGRDEHKVQWLSKEGTPDFLSLFRRLFSKSSEGLPVINLRYFVNRLDPHSAFSPEFCHELGISEASLPPETPLGASIASSAQDLLEELVIELAEAYRQKTGAQYLCVAGGVFLNVLLVHALERSTGFAKVFVQPVAGNAGSALGAAYLARQDAQGVMRRQPLAHLYLGPTFEESQIKAVLDNCKTIYRYLPSERQLIEETVRLLQGDKIVAWYQGRLEFGHRALGNRSILASPFSPYVMENLNRYVKHREDFHPFALSVPIESAAELFDCTDNCRFMSSIGTLKDSQENLERFAFKSRAIRVHTVEKSVNPRFWTLLRKFGEGAPAPLLVNTSFNLFGEPLVCNPREAIRSFYCAGIDAIVMGNFLVVKQ